VRPGPGQATAGQARPQPLRQCRAQGGAAAQAMAGGWRFSSSPSLLQAFLVSFRLGFFVFVLFCLFVLCAFQIAFSDFLNLKRGSDKTFVFVLLVPLYSSRMLQDVLVFSRKSGRAIMCLDE